MSLEKLGSFTRKNDRVQASKPPGRRHRMVTYGVPIGLGLGFAILLAILFRDRLLPARTVNIMSVVTLLEDPGSAPVTANVEQGSDSAFEAPVVFQASGWIEPDPLPVKATTLISGVVDKVFVLEGESVREGDIIATLVDDDAELDLATAEASLRVMESRLVSNEADQDATRASIDVHTKRLKAAEALLVFRLEEADRFASAGPDGIPETTIIESRQKAVAQRSEIEAIESEVAEAMAQLRRILSLREELQAEIALAQTEVERRKLALDRTRIRAPISGRVMRLFAKPGQQRMLGPENHDSAAIAYLYDPDKLQARIDVPLSEAAQLKTGQAALVRSNFLPDSVFRGVVTRIKGEADLQRNTLQAKVAIESPDGRLRPEMLCRAEFLASVVGDREGMDSTHVGLTKIRLYVPESALMGRIDSFAEVWILDESNERIRRQRVKLEDERREDYIRVGDGLRPGDRVVANPRPDLRAGERVAFAANPASKG